MIIGIKSWAEGASAPASFTDWEVVTCYPRPIRDPYDEGRAVDGNNHHYDRKYNKVTIVFSPKTLSSTTPRAALETLLDCVYFRFSDSRPAALTSSNTINFVKQGAIEYDRKEESLATEYVKAEFISEEKQ